jgi:hypothetical protein
MQTKYLPAGKKTVQPEPAPVHDETRTGAIEKQPRQ